MRVVRVDEHRGLALCADAAGVRHTVETALVAPVAAGERLLVHAGVAIASIPVQEDGQRAAPSLRPAAEAGA
jgi:hydrogenase maturation factor